MTTEQPQPPLDPKFELHDGTVVRINGGPSSDSNGGALLGSDHNFDNNINNYNENNNFNNDHNMMHNGADAHNADVPMFISENDIPEVPPDSSDVNSIVCTYCVLGWSNTHLTLTLLTHLLSIF